jgi:hypothetical protein
MFNYLYINNTARLYRRFTLAYRGISSFIYTVAVNIRRNLTFTLKQDACYIIKICKQSDSS